MEGITYIQADTSISLPPSDVPRFVQAPITKGIRTANVPTQGQVISMRLVVGTERPRTRQVQDEFSYHAKKWQRETRHLSSPIDRYLHPSYSRIIALIAANGSEGLRIILRDLKKNQNDWFYALRSITGENPVKSSLAGDVPKMVRAWIKWGETRGLINGSAP